MNQIQFQIALEERRIVFCELAITRLESLASQSPDLTDQFQILIKDHEAILRAAYLSRQKLLSQDYH